jgi:hypothetical protein
MYNTHTHTHKQKHTHTHAHTQLHTPLDELKEEVECVLRVGKLLQLVPELVPAVQTAYEALSY